MEFTPVPADKQQDIIQPRRAAWFQAVMDHGMIGMSSRPTLSGAQADVLEEQGQRMRTRTVKDGAVSVCYVWFEDIPADDLAESDDPRDEVLS